MYLHLFSSVATAKQRAMRENAIVLVKLQKTIVGKNCPLDFKDKQFSIEKICSFRVKYKIL